MGVAAIIPKGAVEGKCLRINEDLWLYESGGVEFELELLFEVSKKSPDALQALELVFPYRLRDVCDRTPYYWDEVWSQAIGPNLNRGMFRKDTCDGKIVVTLCVQGEPIQALATPVQVLSCRTLNGTTSVQFALIEGIVPGERGVFRFSYFVQGFAWKERQEGDTVRWRWENAFYSPRFVPAAERFRPHPDQIMEVEATYVHLVPLFQMDLMEDRSTPLTKYRARSMWCRDKCPVETLFGKRNCPYLTRAATRLGCRPEDLRHPFPYFRWDIGGLHPWEEKIIICRYQTRSFGFHFERKASKDVFYFLVQAYVEDMSDVRHPLNPEFGPGWRSFAEIVRTTKISRYRLYGDPTKGIRGAVRRELEEKRGFMAVSKLRSRGGWKYIARIRYEIPVIKELVDARLREGAPKIFFPT